MTMFFRRCLVFRRCLGPAERHIVSRRWFGFILAIVGVAITGVSAASLIDPVRAADAQTANNPIQSTGAPSMAPEPPKAPKKVRRGPCAGEDLLDWLARTDPEAAKRVRPRPSDARNDGAVLFEIVKDGLPTSYLYGTVHLTDKRATTLPKPVATALKSAKILALEVAELSPTATAKAVSETSELVLLENGQKLDDHLSKGEFAVVRDRLEASGTPPHLARQFQPWVVSMILAVSKCERRQIAKGGLVLDMKLADVARRANIPVVGLERIEEQIATSAAVPFAEQMALLRASIVYAEKAEDLAETVLQLYLDRKLSYAVPLQNVLAEKAGIDGDILRSFRRDLLERRNRLMADRMAPLLADGGAFVAVGAIHLPGENGLVALLRRDGYVVTALH